MKTRLALVSVLMLVGVAVLMGGCAKQADRVSSVSGRSSGPTLVEFSDLNLENAIRRQFERQFEGGIPSTELARITELDLSRTSIKTLDGLEHCVNLTEFSVCSASNQISDLRPLAGLTNLTILNLAGGNQISDLTPLAGLTNLTGLYLSSNQIVDITPLAGLTKLTWLDLVDNQISDLTPLARLTNLTGLYLSSNQISDLTPLAGLTNLTTLHLSSNQIVDISPLARLTNLTTLHLSSNQISDLTPLAGLTKLRHVILIRNRFSATWVTDTRSFHWQSVPTSPAAQIIDELKGRGARVYWQ